uniref:Uncharacterized protein n=1 Tax=Aplanochytrium stocchinoi TaxID=215587 RepID=A0A7S3PR11_9STRA|mmetsp:Transcript_21639/g.27667  ORF Transcript_21639/g.27667 Transcript_21639/m.27667 type:complete len:518 (+) Transcript_21639:222-1775(+)|eukprot:CAMPEP_0204861686 /NCGR_PEP_ID=MMETSP1348-20121228/1817_1 /ASSEMBLY_ACC=CAM_ASM_000700 /TAXON_ID=215587 /ORGANISM="Aplanochytrium stocchinoi, Strain GSBS06" /LENGTH=517 /DNA_ID=CAMNT_0052011225 /DNA_START=106 /DNA_END=1659 /DNA_ORIENTATION=+
MQTLIHQNEVLEKEITELQKQLSDMKQQSVKPKDYRKKSVFQKTLGRKKKNKTAGMDKGDGRPVKILQLITKIHDLILAENFQQAQYLIQDNKKKLFPPKEAAGPKRAFNLKDGFGETVLMKAVRSGNLTVVEKLIDMGAKTDVSDNEGETALMMAAKYGKLGMVKLLAATANKDAKTKFTKKTALMMAAEAGHAEICQELLDHGADPSLENVDGKTALDLAAGVDKKTFKAINKVLKAQEYEDLDDSDVDNSEDEDELAMLLGGDYDEFEKAKKRTYSDDEKMKPLKEKNDELENTKRQLTIEINNLRSKRGPVDQWDKFRNLDKAERNKLLNADTRSQKEVNQILEFHDLVLAGDSSDTIVEIEKILNDKKKKSVKNKPDAFGETALMKATRQGYEDVLDILLLYNCDIDMRDNNGYSAVMKAAEFGKIGCLQKLTAAGANLDFATRKTKLTALMLAATWGHGEICKELIAEGANYDLRDSSNKKAEQMIKNEECRKIFEEAVADNPMNAPRIQI